MTRKQNFKKVTIGQNRKENTNKDYFFFNFFYGFEIIFLWLKNLKSIFYRYMSIVNAKNFIKIDCCELQMIKYDEISFFILKSLDFYIFPLLFLPIIYFCINEIFISA